jgi:alanine dehydrogenase
MLVGVPREIKDNEYRVGIVPSTVRELAEKGHQVVIETQAGAGAGFADADYQSAGAEIVPNGDAVFGRAELIVKVKEPLAAERKRLSRGQVLFTYLHLAPDRTQTGELMARGVTAIAYETVTSQQGTLPLLMPSSSSAVVSQGRTRRRSLPVWEPMLPCLIAIRRRYDGLPRN